MLPFGHARTESGIPKRPSSNCVAEIAPLNESASTQLLQVGTMDEPLVGIIMGSRSDWETMRHAAETLAALGVDCEKRIVSAHRTPDRLFAFARGAKAAGFKVIIAGAGGAAHLPGMAAALTELPVFGVPVESKTLSGVDSLYSIVQMPAGVPVGTLAIGKAGAINAALLAASVLALNDPALSTRLAAWRKQQTDAVKERPEGSA